MTIRPYRERFDEKVDRSGGVDACHPWLGNIGYAGQPLLAILRDSGCGKTSISARRLAWQYAHGAAPTKDQWITTTCGLVGCVNPKHLTVRSIRKTPSERLWPKVDKSGGPDACWPWTGEKLKRYGVVKMRSYRRPGKSPHHETMLAHRLAYELTHGVTLAPEQVIMHLCDNPPCCNPKHLKVGTNAENTLDMWAKGRGSCGEEHGKRVRLGRIVAAAKRLGIAS